MTATPEKILTILVLLGAIVALVRELLPVGMIGILAPLVLVVLDALGVVDVLEPSQLWASLADPAVIAIAGLFVVSAGISRTGAVTFLGDVLSAMARRGRRRILATMMVATAVLSGFVNNTTVVLVCLPVVLTLCERLDHPPSRYLIPLSFAAMFGGMTTLIGTSTNIVVAHVGRTAVDLGQAAHPGWSAGAFDPGMWDFLPMGAIFLAAGVAYMVTIGLRLLPDRVALSMALGAGQINAYVTEVDVTAGSPFEGRTLRQILDRFTGLKILQVIRSDFSEVPDPEFIAASGDVLIVKGSVPDILDLGAPTRGGSRPHLERGEILAREVDMTLAEVIIPPRSRWIGRVVADIGLRDRFGLAVIAVQRHGQHIRQKVRELRVEAGDLLLVQGTVDSLRKVRTSENLILIEGVDKHVRMRVRAPRALGVLGLFVGLVSTGVLDITTGTVLAAAGMALTGCLTIQQAYRAVDWDVIFLLAGFMGLGVAFRESGLAADTAGGLVRLLSDAPTWLLVGVVFAVTAVFTNLLSNVAIAVLMIPVVVEVARLTGASVAMLMMTVAFAASAAFASPLGYQTNLLVYAPGGYRFRDFLVVGLPLTILFTVLAAAFIPVIHGSAT